MRYLALISLMLLGGCADTLYPSLPSYMRSKQLGVVSKEQFPHCQQYDCAVVKNVRLSRQDWSKILQAYGKPAENAAAERQKIARTVGAFERVVGPLTHTDHDREGSFIKTGDGQLDCVDESTNTTVYMLLLQENGLIKFHDIGQPQVRYPIISGRGWMHQTAVVTEKENDQTFAIDSWFEDNGRPAYVVPIETWRDGWHPRPL